MAERPGVWLDLPTSLDLLCHATGTDGTVIGPVGPSSASLRQHEEGIALEFRFDIPVKVKEITIAETTVTIAGNSRTHPHEPAVLGMDDIFTLTNTLTAKFDDTDGLFVPSIAGEPMALNLRAILFGTITLARALMTEHHGTMGCDPDCIARYHEAFPDMTMIEYHAAVGHIKGEWPHG